MLNAHGCEFNVVMGLCIGHDSLFFKYAKGLSTVLVAKDRVLGHNPVAALQLADSYYSRVWGPERPGQAAQIAGGRPPQASLTTGTVPVRSPRVLPVVHPSVPPALATQRLIQIGDQIRRRLQPDRQPDHVRPGARRQPLLVASTADAWWRPGAGSGCGCRRYSPDARTARRSPPA